MHEASTRAASQPREGGACLGVKSDASRSADSSNLNGVVYPTRRIALYQSEVDRAAEDIPLCTIKTEKETTIFVSATNMSDRRIMDKPQAVHTGNSSNLQADTGGRSRCGSVANAGNMGNANVPKSKRYCEYRTGSTACRKDDSKLRREGTQVDRLGLGVKDVTSCLEYPNRVKRDERCQLRRYKSEDFRCRTTGGRDKAGGEDVHLRVATLEKKHSSDAVDDVSPNVLHEQAISIAAVRNRTPNDNWPVKGTPSGRCVSYFPTSASASQDDVDTGIGTYGSKATGRVGGGDGESSKAMRMKSIDVDSITGNRAGLYLPQNANANGSLNRSLSGTNNVDSQADSVKRRRAQHMRSTSETNALPTSTFI